MKKFARIDDGFVVEILVAASLPEFHPSLIWVEANDAVQEGWAWDGNSFTNPETIKTVQEEIEDKLQDLKLERDDRYNLGFIYEGDLFQIDAEAQRNMLAIMVQFTIGTVNPHGGSWFDVDNADVAMTDAQVQVFIQAAYAHIASIKRNYWAHDAAIKALNARQDVIDYDFTTGWP